MIEVRRVTWRPAPVAVLVLILALAAGGCSSATKPPASAAPVQPSATVSPPAADAIHIGVVLPLSGNAATLAAQELAGVQIAIDAVNADGGVAGRPIALDVRDLESAADAAAVISDVAANGASVVIGAYSSDLSVAASTAANQAGLVYWEAGAVADQLTGRGLPLVFRVGASGSNLGTNSAAFAAQELAPRLGRAVSDLRVALVAARDDYASSVAAAARATATASGVQIVADETYDAMTPDWSPVMSTLSAASPDVIIPASHIPDGVAFRKSMVAANLHVGALIGSTMAECDPDFAGELGSDAVGIFASDRPTGGFQPSALDAQARVAYDRLAAAWSSYEPLMPAAPSAPSGDEYPITGPVEEGSAAAGPTEEGVSGFAAAWALARDVLPQAAAAGGLGAQSIAAAARALDLPAGSLPNGAGLHFSTDSATLGQNERAVGVIWQWQAVRSYTFVWPPTYATGSIQFVPLTR